MKYRNKEHLYIVRDDLIVNEGDMTHDEAATGILETNGYTVTDEPYEYFDELSGHNRPLIKWQIARFEDLNVPQKHPFASLLKSQAKIQKLMENLQKEATKLYKTLKKK